MTGAHEPLEWPAFAHRLAEAIGADPEHVRRETRLAHDLQLDSLEIAEVVVVLLVDFELEGLSDRLQRSGWDDITAGDVYDEYRAGPRGGWDVRIA